MLQACDHEVQCELTKFDPGLLHSHMAEALRRGSGKEVCIPAGLASSLAPTWSTMPASQLAAVSSAAEPPHAAAQKLAGPSIATPASLYAGMQALSAANPTASAGSQTQPQALRPPGNSHTE